MITAAIRSGLLANFPPGTTVHALGGGEAIPASAVHVIVEGLDAVEDPVALLADIRAAAPQARLFALVANGAYLPALAVYFGGTRIAAVRPLTRIDVERILAASGWHQIGLETIADDAAFAAPELPAAVRFGLLKFQIDDAATLERVRPAAFLAIADQR
jgi:hypothetical protein